MPGLTRCKCFDFFLRKKSFLVPLNAYIKTDLKLFCRCLVYSNFYKRMKNNEVVKLMTNKKKMLKV